VIILPKDPDLYTRKTQGGKNHKPNCPCRICTPTRAAIAAGKIPMKAQLKKPGIRKATPRHRLFAKGVAAQIASGSGKTNLKEAALAAGYTENDAAHHGSELVRRPEIQGLILRALNEAGITQQRLADVASRGLDATETKLVTFEGEVKSREEIPDWHARHKFWRDSNMIFGNFPKEEGNVQQAALIVKLPGDAKAEDSERYLEAYFNQQNKAGGS
jgi:hypothetical protein